MSQLQPSPPQADQGYLVDNATLLRLGDGSIDKGRARLRLLLADEQDRAPRNGPVEKPENVRLAGIRDEPAILDLLLGDLAENATTVAPVSIARIMENVVAGTRGKGGFVPVIDGPDGSPIALAMVCPERWWWSDQVFLSETVIYVAPEARTTNAANDLLTYLKWLAQAMTEASGEQVYLVSGVLTLRRASAKMRFYARQMNRAGGYFYYPAVGEGA